MNGTARKINLFNQALAKVIEDKIMIKEDSLDSEGGLEQLQGQRIPCSKEQA